MLPTTPTLLSSALCSYCRSYKPHQKQIQRAPDRIRARFVRLDPLNEIATDRDPNRPTNVDQTFQIAVGAYLLGWEIGTDPPGILWIVGLWPDLHIELRRAIGNDLGTITLVP